MLSCSSCGKAWMRRRRSDSSVSRSQVGGETSPRRLLVAILEGYTMAVSALSMVRYFAILEWDTMTVSALSKVMYCVLRAR